MGPVESTRTTNWMQPHKPQQLRWKEVQTGEERGGGRGERGAYHQHTGTKQMWSCKTPIHTHTHSLTLTHTHTHTHTHTQTLVGRDTEKKFFFLGSNNVVSMPVVASTCQPSPARVTRVCASMHLQSLRVCVFVRVPLSLCVFLCVMPCTLKVHHMARVQVHSNGNGFNTPSTRHTARTSTCMR